MTALDARFWRRCWRVAGLGVGIATLGCLGAGQVAAALSVLAGGAVGAGALLTLRLTAGAYVQAGHAVGGGASPRQGRTLRGALLLSRMLLVVLSIKLVFLWDGVSATGFAAGVTLVQLAVPVAALILLRKQQQDA